MLKVNATSPGLSSVLPPSPVNTAVCPRACFPSLSLGCSAFLCGLPHGPTHSLFASGNFHTLTAYLHISLSLTLPLSLLLAFPSHHPLAKLSFKSCAGPLSLPGQAHSGSWFECTFPPNEFPTFISSHDPFPEFQGSDPTQPKPAIKWLSKQR